MRVVLLTVHQADSKRKVDFHFWAEELQKKNIKTDFITIGFSRATSLKKDGRIISPPYNVWEEISPLIRRFVWRPMFHPFSFNNKFLDMITAPLFSLYSELMPNKLLSEIEGADLFIVENGAGLLLVPKLAKMFPQARFIYSVCDRLQTLGYHPLILKAEKSALEYFNLIRVPAEVMCADYDSSLNVRHIPHGLVKSQFDDNKYANPYKKNMNAVCVGDMLFDNAAIETMAEKFPSCDFHLFGRKAIIEKDLANVKAHGEQPFDKIIPYIVHANIGLAPYKNAVNADYLSQSSMKMIQYTYCQLPILAPDFAASGRAHVCGYTPNNPSSIALALEKAASFDRKSIDNKCVMTWKETIEQML